VALVSGLAVVQLVALAAVKIWEGVMEAEDLFGFFNEDYSIFIEAGFVAVKQLDEISGRRLFKAAEALNKDNPAAQLGLGYIALNKLQVSEAASIFETIMEKNPDHHLTQALLGVAYLLSQDKRGRGEHLILDVREKSDDPTIKNLANVCLDWLKKDLNSKSIPPLKAKVE